MEMTIVTEMLAIYSVTVLHLVVQLALVIS